jgi:hypothetical protein
MINLINKLETEFGLMNLYKKGIISWSILRDRDIYLKYDIYIKKGKSIMDAKHLTAEDFKVGFDTVHRAIEKMKADEENGNSSK